MKKLLLMVVVLGTAAVGAFAQNSTGDGVRDAIVEKAESYLGTPYRFGGTTPAGFDCSGLIYRVYRDASGKTLPRRTEDLFREGVEVSPTLIRPGDLVFFDTTGGVSHVGLYIGGNRFIHAASDGPTTGVIISDFSEEYYRDRFLGVRRFLPAPSTVDPLPGDSKPLDAAFHGNFVMSFGTMTLRVSDAEGNVQGVFTSSGHSGWIIGKIDREAGVLRADWVIPETDSYYRTSGQIVFTPSKDGRKLTGAWRYEGEESWQETWIAIHDAP